jgi:hypothetical protein
MNYENYVRSKKSRLQTKGVRSADRATSLYPQKLALTSPTSGGRARSRTKGNGVCFLFYMGIISWKSCNSIFEWPAI